jgi:UDP-N-acetylglucosamine transferase subunit ALG13
VNSKEVPSVFVTHQLRVLSGSTTWLSSKLQQRYLQGFDECWVPDFHERSSLSGKMGHLKQSKPNVKYIGPISRFEKREVKKIYDLAIILSGPEPQRSIFEDILKDQLKSFKGKVLLVQGVVQEKQKKTTRKHLTVANFMLHKELEQAINASDIILARSGYTTIMDLAKLEKRAFFVPTPGQFEQEYLAKNLNKRMIAPSCSQKDFKMKHINKVHFYKGFTTKNNELDLKDLFGLFKGE